MTLYKGTKSDAVLDRIATTFVALCEYADFSGGRPTSVVPTAGESISEKADEEVPMKTEPTTPTKQVRSVGDAVALDSLQYHINIVLPDTRDQSVYDAIFRSLREQLGGRHE